MGMLMTIILDIGCEYKVDDTGCSTEPWCTPYTKKREADTYSTTRNDSVRTDDRAGARDQARVAPLTP